jgi:hypothetical protein
VNQPSLSDILSGKHQSLQKVWDWYEFQRALIGEEKSRVLDALAHGAGLASPRYVWKMRDELESDFKYQADELAEVAKLGMLASTEAALWVDFVERVWNKKKDTVSRRFLTISGGRWWSWSHWRRIRKIRLEEDILDTWRDHGSDPGIKHVVSEFKGALNLRHWLAHGRYWEATLGRALYDVVDVFDICRELLQATGLPF